MKKILLSKEYRFMMKLIKPSLKKTSDESQNNFQLDDRINLSKSNISLIKQNSEF